MVDARIHPKRLPPTGLSTTGVMEWLDEQLGQESYGAPRVFDLFTLLAVTLAFAILCALLRILEPLLFFPLAQAASSIGGFGALTAIAQLTLWGGKKPRLASLAAGPVIWLFISLMLSLQNMALFHVAYLAGLVILSVLGIPTGYLAGALVAGVFLLADLFRKRFLKHELDENAQEYNDSIWK